MLEEGRVRVHGVPQPKPATLVDETVPMTVAAPSSEYVSRGGHKLAAALTGFSVPVDGRRALDAGASTGGFTDCLLQYGAAEVVTVDVGYGQLDWRLRNDPRVRVVERTNIRHVDPGELGGPFELVVADLSFISLCLVAPVLARAAAPGADLVLLVKPQFEVGKGEVGKGGLVRDPVQRLTAVRKVIDCLQDAGLGTCGVMASPLPGAKGNREFLLWARPGPVAVGDDEVRSVVLA